MECCLEIANVGRFAACIAYRPIEVNQRYSTATCAEEAYGRASAVIRTTSIDHKIIGN